MYESTARHHTPCISLPADSLSLHPLISSQPDVRCAPTHRVNYNDREIDMAKPKLSVAQRKALRKEIGQRLSKKEEPAVIVKAISEKYKIVSFTARWYLRTVLDSRLGRKPGKKAAAKASAPKRKAPARRKVKATRGAGADGLLEAAIAKSAQRVRLARQLYPKLQTNLNRARDLRRQEARTGKSASESELRAKKLEARIRQLTSR